MEDLSAVAFDSGVLFGPGNPNNWQRDDLATKASRAGNVSAHIVAHETFCAVVRLHAHFWNDASLLENDKEWLRGQQWIQGRGKASWEASQAMVRDTWETCNRDSIQWDPLLRKVTAKAIAGISWEAQLQRLSATQGHWAPCLAGQLLVAHHSIYQHLG
jgi:hypothetical protein